MNHHLRLVAPEQEKPNSVGAAAWVILGATLGYGLLVVYLVTAR